MSREILKTDDTRERRQRPLLSRTERDRRRMLLLEERCASGPAMGWRFVVGGRHRQDDVLEYVAADFFQRVDGDRDAAFVSMRG